MTTFEFVRKLFGRCVLFIAILILITTLTSTFDVVIQNQLAIAQLEDDDISYIFFQVYQNTVKPIVIFLCSVTCFSILVTTGIDVYKFIFTRRMEKFKDEDKNDN